jgi:hypothetical protein
MNRAYWRKPADAYPYPLLYIQGKTIERIPRIIKPGYGPLIEKAIVILHAAH